MEQAASAATTTQAIVTRIFRKYGGESKILKKFGRSLADEVGAKTLCITLGTLPKSAVLVTRLVQAGIEAGSKNCHGINRIVGE